jgi:3-phytase
MYCQKKAVSQETTVMNTSTRAATAAFVLCMASSIPAQLASVSATVETTPVPHSGDSADDMVVWVHPTIPSQSLVIGTDKHGGIAVYDLTGTQLQYLPDGNLNNVDLRYNFRLGSSEVALATSGERTQNLLACYAVDPSLRHLYNVAAHPIPLGFNVYGCCMYHSHVTGDYYFICNSDTGHVEQWRLFDNGTGHVDATRVRTFEVGSITEGCVADDENGWLFIAEENVGIWRYGAEPNAGTSRLQIDSTGATGHLTADVEGLAIYYTAGGGGCLLASSQGNSRFVAYDRAAPHAYRLTFQIVANAALGIDAVSGTDGIDVVNLGMGSAFPSGCFLAQDDVNTGANQNFKLVPWQAIANAAVPPLPIDTLYDALGVHRAATATAYGTGCGSPALGFVPDANGRPLLGQVGSATITDTPTPLAGVAVGWSNQFFGTLPLPVSLDSIGMPGCSLLQSADILGLGTSPLTPTTNSFALAIPSAAGLIGTHLYMQAYAFAPGVNPLQIVISNGIEWRLGDV